MKLTEKRCVPCEGGVPKLDEQETARLVGELEGWSVDGEKLVKPMTFPNFVEAMGFVNRMAELAEEEGHHPDFCVHYNRVDVSIWTHAIGGLSENDFILAAKIDELE